MRVQSRVPIIVLVLLFICTSVPLQLFAGGNQENATAGKSKVSFFMNLYEGLTDQYISDLQKAFNAANPKFDLQISSVDWQLSLDKLKTAIAGGGAPDASIIGTYWLVELDKLGAVAEADKYVSKTTIDNCAAGALDASRINGKLMGLPVAAGSRFLAINTDIDAVVPTTMEQLRQEAIRVNNPPAVSGLIMPGKKITELTDYLYYLYAAGGDVFATNPNGSYGKCIVNNAAGVKALSFMVQLATQDKVVEPNFLSLTREEAQPVFAAGKAAYALSGAWMAGMYKSANANFKVKYDQIPSFQGVNGKTLIVTDSIAIFKDGKNKEGVGKFIDFFYQDQWKARFDELIGFPPVTISAGKLPQFQIPMYQAMAVANGRAKPYPLVDNWNQFQSIIWDATVEAFTGNKTPQKALDDAAAQIDQIRGM